MHQEKRPLHQHWAHDLAVVDGASNQLNIHLTLEDFFAQVLNAVPGVRSRNANYVSFNDSGYDLVGDGSGLLIQATANDSSAPLCRTIR
ncbi:SMEK domain-containing protein [Adlercreutzia caecimuris]|uniref:SMEK domain-containing protein n=1 Tax=Adlercreutzia caecimuris TaxID=671266 RepID=UPI0012ED7331